MLPTEVTYTRRFKTGDYEHEEYTVNARVEEGEAAGDALIDAKSEVIKAFTSEAKPTEQPAVKPAKQPKGKKEKKNARDNEASSSDNEDANNEDSELENPSNDVEGAEDDEAADDSDSDNNDDSSDDSEESVDEAASEPEAPPKKEKASGGKKGFKKKPQAYNRSIEQHKEIFSGVLKSVNPDWKKSEASKLKAKQVSQQMESNAFLDENGEVLPEFTAKVKKLMKK